MMTHQNGSMLQHRMDIQASQHYFEFPFCAMSSISRIPWSCKPVGFSWGSQAASYMTITRVYLQEPRGSTLCTVLCFRMFFPKQDASLHTSMYLLIWHLKCTKEFLCLIHALWQNMTFRKQAPKNCQHNIEGISTQDKLGLHGY